MDSVRIDGCGEVACNSCSPEFFTEMIHELLDECRFAGTDGTQDIDRKIVRTGALSLVVEDVLDVIERISSTTDSFDGYIVSSRSWREGERLIGIISVRVPAEYFSDVIKAFRGLAVEVTSESTSSKDIV